MRAFYWVRLAVALVATVGASIARAETAPPSGEVVGKFLEQYCLDCHDSTTKKGKRNLEAFKLPLKSVADLISTREIIDEITLKEMPPKKADQPADEERLAVLRALREGTLARLMRPCDA
jgi:mono/diheme cytochrome c family protein